MNETPAGSAQACCLSICRRCGKRQGGGFGNKGKTGLARTLRRALADQGHTGDRVAIVETGCLTLCPADGVAMIDSRFPREHIVVRCGISAEAVLADLDARSIRPGAPPSPGSARSCWEAPASGSRTTGS